MRVLQWLEAGTLCFTGYARNTAPVLRLRKPGGATAMRAGEFRDGAWQWDVRPGAAGSALNEQGVYRFEIEGRRAGAGWGAGDAGAPMPGRLVLAGEIMVVAARHRAPPSPTRRRPGG